MEEAFKATEKTGRFQWALEQTFCKEEMRGNLAGWSNFQAGCLSLDFTWLHSGGANATLML